MSFVSSFSHFQILFFIVAATICMSSAATEWHCTADSLIAAAYFIQVTRLCCVFF